MAEHQEIFERCRDLVQQRNFARAVEVAAGFAALNPESGLGWVAMGWARYWQGDLPGARDALETASLLVPLDAATRSILAECFARTGHLPLACHVYQTLADDDQTPTDLLPAVAAGLGLLGEFGPALQVCLELTRRCPDRAEAHFGVAFYLRKLGRSPDSVIPVVARAYELSPDVPLYRVTLATLLDHLGRREEACELLRELDFSTVSCRCCLQRMTTIFRTPSDQEPGLSRPDQPR